MESGPRVYQAFPYHWLIDPSESELRAFLHRERAVGLRYSTGAGSRQGYPGYHAVYNEPRYELEDLGNWARKNVRRGLRNCTVKPVALETLAESGWSLQLDTLDRQGRQVKLAQPAWRRLCLSAANLPGFEAWGAFVDGGLAASLIAFQMDDCAYLLHQACLHQHLTKHVNNALSFVVTQNLVGRSEVKSIFYGLHSLDAPASVDEFKFRMGYAAKPVRQRVVFHPWLRGLSNTTSYNAVNWLHRRRPGNPTLAKAEGMLRFNIHGQ